MKMQQVAFRRVFRSWMLPITRNYFKDPFNMKILLFLTTSHCVLVIYF